MHGLREREVALIGERSVDQFLRVALILKGIIEGRVGHVELDCALLLGEPELLVPVPVGREDGVASDEDVDDCDLVDDVQDQRFYLCEDELILGEVALLGEVAEQGLVLLLEGFEAAAAVLHREGALGVEGELVVEADDLRAVIAEGFFDVVPFDAAGLLLQSSDHVLVQLLQPVLHHLADLNFLAQLHLLLQVRPHGQDLLVPLPEDDCVNAREQLLEVQLNDGRILRLAQDLQHIVVSKEVEPREFVSLLLKEVVECLLAPF